MKPSIVLAVILFVIVSGIVANCGGRVQDGSGGSYGRGELGGDVTHGESLRRKLMHKHLGR
jgi:hypothetical protein